MAVRAPTHRFTSEEYARLVERGALDGLRVELLDGGIVDVSPQSPEHAAIIQRLTRLLAARADVLRVQLPLDVADGWQPEPDVALAPDAADPLQHPQTAWLAVEVAVSSHAVDERKATVYARAGVDALWIVDVPGRTIRVLQRPGPDGYAEERLLRDAERLELPVAGLPAFSVGDVLGDLSAQRSLRWGHRAAPSSVLSRKFGCRKRDARSWLAVDGDRRWTGVHGRAPGAVRRGWAPADCARTSDSGH